MSCGFSSATEVIFLILNRASRLYLFYLFKYLFH